MTSLRLNPSDIAAPVGAYSHGIATPAGGTWLHVSGQIGLLPDGALASGFAGQARAALANLAAVLKTANMDANHLVKVTTFLLDSADLKELGPIRSEFLGAARPASTLLVVKSLARAEWLIEIEAVAHRD
ncbi:MAG: RidA family protein [Casimicrobiaceae bacterium]